MEGSVLSRSGDISLTTSKGEKPFTTKDTKDTKEKLEKIHASFVSFVVKRLFDN
jgi:hypothetical protein